MVRYDILAGIKNAVERGSSIEKAKQSLINAGYSVSEVNEAINYITGGVSSRMSLPVEENQKIQMPQKSQQQKPEDNKNNKEELKEKPKTDEKDHHENMISNTNYQKAFEKQKNKGHFPWKIVILVFLLIILIGVLGAVILFKDSIITYLNSVLG